MTNFSKRTAVWTAFICSLWSVCSPAQDWQTAYDSAAIANRQLRYHQARPWAIKALALAEQQLSRTDSNYAKTLDILAEADNYLEYYDEALQAGQTALAIWERTYGRQHHRYVYTLQTVAESYQYLVQYPKADSLHQIALTRTQDRAGAQSTDYAIALNRLALFYRTMGLQAKAIATAEQAKAIFEQLDDQHSVAYALVLQNLSDLYIRYLEEYIIPNIDTAIGLLTKAILLIERIGSPQSPVYAECLHTLSSAYHYRNFFLKQKIPDIEVLLTKALETLSQTIGPNTSRYNSCAEDLADYYRRKGNNHKARKIFEQILMRSDSVNGRMHPYHTVALFKVGQIYTLLNLDRQAEPYIVQCNQNLIREVRLFSATLTDEEREQLLKNASNGFIWLHSYARLFARHNPAITAEQYNTQLAIKGFLLHADQKFRRRIGTHTDTSLQRLYAHWQTSRDRLATWIRLTRTEQLRRGIRTDSLEQHVNTLEKQVALRLPQLTGELALNPKTWQDVQKTLQPGEAAIELVRYRTYQVRHGWGKTDTVHYAALIVTPNCAYPDIVILENGNVLEGPLLTAYRNDILDQTHAADSYRQYWKPIRDALKGIRRVYLAPDGVYHQINLNTLRNPETGRYVLDEQEIVLVTTTNDLLQAKPTPPTGQPTALLIGYPDYGLSEHRMLAQRDLAGPTLSQRAPRTRLSRDGYYEPLPATKREVADIGQLLRSRFTVHTYTDTAAREEVVKTTASPTVLHIATHGFFETDTALGHTLTSPLFRSGLVLADANRTLTDTATADLFSAQRREDGILTAYEAMNLTLDQTDLVVLSACQTGLGEVRNGEGVYGLQRAFKVAGARSLLMSLWKVDDDLTRQLMTAFYANWLQSGDKVQAFRLAQQAIRKQYPQPFYWGGFVLVGQ
ncbi:CHAT domain-containing protein [Nibrella viscosa]|uniref:CHAT domain-containing protein n=1 Tax=Nibrella viscosa TaxID=1084524 RepID=A0ABP8KXU1_9BACT